MCLISSRVYIPINDDLLKVYLNKQLLTEVFKIHSKIGILKSKVKENF